MNGQVYQSLSLVAAVKQAMQLKADIDYTYLKYQNSITFTFLPQKKLLFTKSHTADNVDSWFGELKKKELVDIKLLMPTNVENRFLLGFSNASQDMMVCFYKSGDVSYFVADWQFDSEKKHWNTAYTEHVWENPPHDKPRFENNVDAFREVLGGIEKLATEIGALGFADTFKTARMVLDGEHSIDTTNNIPLPALPLDKLNIFKAASIADVFGAMGSWNDSPPYMAKEKGLEKEYEALSNRLLENLRKATLYAINEW